MGDTFDLLKITKPLPVRGLGRLFWSESYMHKRVPLGTDTGDFLALAGLPWIQHYSVPHPSYTEGSWDFAVNLELEKENRPVGRECFEINVDYLMGELEWRCGDDKGQKRKEVVLDSLRLRKLFLVLKKLTVELRCENLLCLYDPVEFDGNHGVYINFQHCFKLPAWEPDVFLPQLVKRLGQLLEAA